MIETIIQFLKDTIESLGYPGVALSMFLESFFAPIPSEAIIPFAGFLASEGKMSIPIIVAVGSIFSYLGTLPFYFVGKLFDKTKIDSLVSKYGKFIFISNNEVDKAFKLFEKHGRPLIFFGRLIPIVRSLISLPAGMAKMNFAVFTGFTIAGASIWTSFLAVAGFYLGKNWEVVGAFIENYEKIIYVLIGAVFLLFVGYKVREKLRDRKKMA